MVQCTPFAITGVGIPPPIGDGGMCNDPLKIGCISGIPDTFIMAGALALIVIMAKK